MMRAPNVYHTCHTFTEPGRRLGANVAWYKCAVADIDIRGNKGEPDEDTLLEKLVPVAEYYGDAFHLNRSGGGVHLYIVFKEPVEYAVWSSASRDLLQRLAHIKGVDPQCTNDKSRVLRVPGSLHPSSGREVEVLEWAKAGYAPRFVPSADTPRPALDPRYKGLAPEHLVLACAHIAKLAEGWDSQPYESWFGCGTVLKHVSGGEEAFYEWSKKGDQWDEAKAIQVIETTEAIQGCEKFASVGGCESCPFYGKGGNPLVHAIRLQSYAAVPKSLKPSEIPLPEGYFIEGTAIYLNAKPGAKGKAGGKMDIANTPFYVSEVFRDPETKEYMINFAYWAGRWDNFTIPKSIALRNEGSKLAGRYVTHVSRQWEQYVYDSLKLYEDTHKGTKPMSNFFGWKAYDNPDGVTEDVFILGRDVISKDGIIAHSYIDTHDANMTRLVPYLSAIYQDGLEERRLFDEWYQLMNDFMLDPTIHLGSKVQVAVSLATPLFYLAATHIPKAGLGGITINTWGESGKGKSLGVKVAASIWGKPGGEGLPGLMYSDISPAAVYLALEKTRHLPFCMDEVLSNPIGSDPKVLDDFIKAISNGKSPERSTSDGRPRPSFIYNTSLLSSSQTSMMDFIASGVPAPVAAATRMRLIEFEIPGSAIDLKGKASKYDRFYDLCGLAGRRWIEYVLQPDVLVDFVAHMERVSLGSFKTDGRFIAKLLHLLRWVVPHAHHDKAAIINFPAKFLAEFEETQKQAMLDADRQRLLTPGQQAILAYITKYRDKSLTYKVIPNGKVPQGQRLPSDPSCWAYQQGTVMVIEVESPKCTLIP
jgi:hypothetical protein